ncbi:hypothetical protein [Achromobacter aloeverae]
MSATKEHSQLQAARKLAVGRLSKLGETVSINSPLAEVVHRVAARMAVRVPDGDPTDLFIAFVQQPVATPRGSIAENNQRRPLRLSPALRFAAERAAFQPRLIPAASNVDNWREIGK